MSLILTATTVALFLQGITEYNFGNSAVMKAFWSVTGSLIILKMSFMDNKKIVRGTHGKQ